MECHYSETQTKEAVVHIVVHVLHSNGIEVNYLIMKLLPQMETARAVLRLLLHSHAMEIWRSFASLLYSWVALTTV